MQELATIDVVLPVSYKDTTEVQVAAPVGQGTQVDPTLAYPTQVP